MNQMALRDSRKECRPEDSRVGLPRACWSTGFSLRHSKHSSGGTDDFSAANFPFQQRVFGESSVLREQQDVGVQASACVIQNIPAGWHEWHALRNEGRG